MYTLSRGNSREKSHTLKNNTRTVKFCIQITFKRDLQISKIAKSLSERDGLCLLKLRIFE